MGITKEKIVEYAARYDNNRSAVDEKVENELLEWFKSRRYLDRENFIKLGIWKTGPRLRRRYESNDELTIVEVTNFCLKTKSERARIKALFTIDGVSYPVASVILHFAFPDKYSILDFRALWSLGGEWRVRSEKQNYDFCFWQKYYERILEISKSTGESIRNIDKALWQYSKEHQKNSENEK